MESPNPKLPPGDIPSVYRAIRFRTEVTFEYWPQEFVVVTAYATTGQNWSLERNTRADVALREELEIRRGWLRRVIGFSPATGHAEPGWAVRLPLNEACDLGGRYLQDAIFHVCHDDLSFTYCDSRRGLVPVGGFRERLEPRP